MTFELQFLGAAGTVTGSKYLITHKGRKILVDCGLFQGAKTLQLKNYAEFSSQIPAISWKKKQST